MATNDTNELRHYGVLGMKWGVRKARGTAVSKSKRSSSKKKTSEEQAVKNVKRKITKERAAKAAAKGAEVCAKVAQASLVDDMFYGGAGKKIAKETIKQTGRAVVTAYTMANGGYDIHWYDK